MALGVGPGDEVITPTFSFFATAGCVSRARRDAGVRRHRSGDVQRRSGAPSRGDHAAHQGDHPRAPLRAVRRHGSAARRSRGARGMPVIEDAAQAIGATYKGRQAGIDGHGRLLLVLPEQEPRRVRRRRAADDRTTTALAHEVRLLRNHGAEPKYFHKRIGGNFRLDALQAAVLRVKLPHLDALDATRAGATPTATTAVRRERRRGSRRRCRSRAPTAGHIYNQYVIRVPDRDARARAARAARHRHRDLLSGAVPPAGVLRAARLPPGRLSRSPKRAAGRDAGAADLRRADRGAAARGRRRSRSAQSAVGSGR